MKSYLIKQGLTSALSHEGKENQWEHRKAVCLQGAGLWSQSRMPTRPAQPPTFLGPVEAFFPMQMQLGK